MKKTGGVICVVLLLFVGLSITPAMGSTQKADMINQSKIRYYFETEELITLDFFDYTGKILVKKEVQVPYSVWISLRDELRGVRKSSLSIEDSLNAQFDVLREYGLISSDVSFEYLRDGLRDGLADKSKDMNRIRNRVGITPLINNSIFNAMCAIDFELTNGSTFVFGLNTFVNYIGFDIISVHKGYATGGIDTKGLVTKYSPPGEYVGVMFGFLGYWLGEKTGIGFYSNVTIAGFTVLTAWLPIPLFP